MQKTIFKFREFNRTIFLTIIAAFLNLITTPTFASQPNHSQKKPTCDANTVALCWPIMFNNSCPASYSYDTQDSYPKSSQVEDNKQGTLDGLKESGNYIIGLIFFPLSDNKKESLKKYLEKTAGYVTDDAEFYANYYTDYIDSFRYPLTKEVGKKTLARYLRSGSFKGATKSAFSFSESGIFFKRNTAEPFRNIRRQIADAKAVEDYPKAKMIITTSLINQMAVLPLQIFIGFKIAPSLSKLGQPQEVCDMVDTYSKWSIPGSTFSEFSGKTANELLVIEREEYQLLPPILNALAEFLFYRGSNRLLGSTEDPKQSLKRLAMSKTAANVLTTAGVFGLIAYDKKYDKYKIFSIDENGFWDWQTTKELLNYGNPVFISQLPGTISYLSGLLSVGLFGADHLSAKKEFEQVALLIKPFVAAGANVAKKLTINSVTSKDESAEETRSKMQLGILSNAVMATPYLAIFIINTAQAISAEEKDRHYLVAVSSFIEYVYSIERAANEELSAFGQDEQSWFKYVGDAIKTGVPIVGFVLLYKGVLDQNMRNYAILQVLATLPSIFNIIAAWNH